MTQQQLRSKAVVAGYNAVRCEERLPDGFPCPGTAFIEVGPKRLAAIRVRQYEHIVTTCDCGHALQVTLESPIRLVKHA